MKHGLQIINSWEFFDGPYAEFIDSFSVGDRISLIFSENGQPRIIDTTVRDIAYNESVDTDELLTKPRQLYLDSSSQQPYILETDGKLVQFKLPDGNVIPEVDIYRLEQIDGDNGLRSWIQWKVKFTVTASDDDEIFIWFTRAPQSSMAKQRAESQLLSKYSAIKIKDVEPT